METSFYTDGRAFRVPPGLDDLRGYPLYVLIATWGLRQRQVLTTPLISRVFFITHNQARDALYYIRHESSGRIRSEAVPVRDGLHPFCKGLRILSVEPGAVPVPARKRPEDITVPKTVSVKAERKGAEDPVRVLRQWMLSRRHGERVPSSLLSSRSEL